MNQLFFGKNVQGFLVGLIFILLGMGTLLPLFLIVIFLGAVAVEEKTEVVPPSSQPKIEEYQAPDNQVFAAATEDKTYKFQL